MIWIIASVPFWFLGILFGTLGTFAIGKIAFSSGDQTFRSATDEKVMGLSFGLLVASGALLFIAAKVASNV